MIDVMQQLSTVSNKLFRIARFLFSLHGAKKGGKVKKRKFVASNTATQQHHLRNEISKLSAGPRSHFASTIAGSCTLTTDDDDTSIVYCGRNRNSRLLDPQILKSSHANMPQSIQIWVILL
jgi:hypothetical protein